MSSTGHLLLVQHFFGFDDDDFGKTFVILIQLGAILALLWVYFERLWKIALAVPNDPAARRFVIGVLVAFLPAVVIGLLLGGFIKAKLLNPWVVCVSLIVGGAILLWVDRLQLKPRYADATQFPIRTYGIIGLCQCLAMIPGVSRSGATIVSAMLLGADKRAATEFSFFLAMPTMMGAFAYTLYKDWRRDGRQQAHRRDRLRLLVRGRLDRGEIVARLRLQPRLCAVCLVAHHGGRDRADALAIFRCAWGEGVSRP